MLSFIRGPSSAVYLSREPVLPRYRLTSSSECVVNTSQHRGSPSSQQNISHFGASAPCCARASPSRGCSNGLRASRTRQAENLRCWHLYERFGRRVPRLQRACSKKCNPSLCPSSISISNRFQWIPPIRWIFPAPIRQMPISEFQRQSVMDFRCQQIQSTISLIPKGDPAVDRYVMVELVARDMHEPSILKSYAWTAT